MKNEKLEALQNCLKHWVWVMNQKEPWNYSTKESYFKIHDLPVVYNNCYACEYTTKNSDDGSVDCTICPLNGYAWKKEYEVGCESDPSSPYNDWCECDDGFSEAIDAIEKMISCIEDAIEDVKQGDI